MKPQKLPNINFIRNPRGRYNRKNNKKVSSFTNLENKQYQAIDSLIDLYY